MCSSSKLPQSRCELLSQLHSTCIRSICRRFCSLGASSFCSLIFFFFSSRRRHTRFDCDWSSDVCSSDLPELLLGSHQPGLEGPHPVRRIRRLRLAGLEVRDHPREARLPCRGLRLAALERPLLCEEVRPLLPESVPPRCEFLPLPGERLPLPPRRGPGGGRRGPPPPPPAAPRPRPSPPRPRGGPSARTALGSPRRAATRGL